MKADANQKKTKIRGEIKGIVLLALTLFISISLLSYHFTADGDPTSWVGLIGDYFAQTLLFVLGFASYIIPCILLYLAILFFTSRDAPLRLSKLFSLIVLILSLSGFLAHIISNGKVVGGILGDYISVNLSIYLGFTGTVIFLGAALLASIVGSTGLSFIRFVANIFSIILSVILWIFRHIKPSSKDKASRTSQKKEPVREERSEGPPTIITPPVSKKQAKPKEEHIEHLEFQKPTGEFQLPHLSFLESAPEHLPKVDKSSLIESSRILEQKLQDFDVYGNVTEVRPGPVVTMYEYSPAPGIKVNKIMNLADDLALAMKAMSIRIIAPIPGKSVVGIEIPNKIREQIYLIDLLDHKEYRKSISRLTIALGRDISGTPVVANLAKMPHLLVAGATGAGKSVFVNTLIISILYKATPDEVRFLMIDPKMLELSPYEGIPHLLTPVVTEAKRAAGMLKGIVIEMEERYRRMSEMGVKNIDSYNKLMKKEVPGNTEDDEKVRHKKLPHIVVIIDELSDLMMVAGKDVEESLVRLSQMARASGIHLILATQRPSVDVITGLIKSNFPARISFQVASKTDSRTILDANGAEKLLGQGDMLFLPPATSKIQRIHGAYISEEEIERITGFLKRQGKPAYEKSFSEMPAESNRLANDEEYNEDFMKRFDEAVKLAASLEMISTSYIQRRFRIGYNTAARIIEKMEADGIVGPSQGSKPREVLLGKKRAE